MLYQLSYLGGATRQIARSDRAAQGTTRRGKPRIKHADQVTVAQHLAVKRLLKKGAPVEHLILAIGDHR